MNKKKQIDWFTVVLADTHGGGAEQQQINIFQHLVDTGKKCYVICLTKKNMGCWEFMEKKGRVLYLPFSNKYAKISYLLLFPVLFYTFLTKRISYTFTTQTLINSAIGIFKRIGFLKRTKVIVRESNSIFKLMSGLKLKRYAFSYKIGYSKVDLVICQTEYMKNQLLEALPWLSKKVTVCVIDNPINLKAIAEKAKEYIEASEGEEYMVAAGSLHPKKGFDILIDSFFKLQDKHPSIKLFILGEGKERSSLIKQINSLHLENKVFLKGFTSNVYPYFKNAKLCVMSSRIEGFPNVLLQMMSQNHKVVSTISAGGIENIEGIFTSPIKDAEKLAYSIDKALNSKTKKNRVIFDSFLAKRDLESFIKKIHLRLPKDI
ncbi:glycosyltransferase [Algibacter sp. R77976]|uniref:glycosyltransferase n=1 Tax=Algibacter sp. R77976 TaxID=3093873 RepID=UPI0037C78784